MSPLILLDVDGPLNPWAAPPGGPDGYVEHRYPLSRWPWTKRVLRVRLDPAHGPALLRLADAAGARLVWATTWAERANTVIGPAIGLPPLPVIRLTDSPAWKFPDVQRYAGDRPLVWFDDDFGLHPGPRDAFLARPHPTALIPVDPRTGLTAGDIERAQEWLVGLRGDGPGP